MLVNTKAVEQKKEDLFVIWIKRLSPLVLILVLWFAYSTYNKYREKKLLAEADHNALVTAQLWVGSAKYRTDPAKFAAFRDSIININSLSSNMMDDYLKRLETNPDFQEIFAQKVKQYVDSLIIIEDSLRKNTTKETNGLINKDSIK
jgi:hypothetical protein